MPGSRIDQYRRWFEYEKDSHRKVMASFETVPSSQDDSPPLQKALDIMAHVVAARRMWLFRLGITTERPADFAPTGVRLGELADQLEIMERDWDDYLRRLTDDQLDRAIRVQEPGRGAIPQLDGGHPGPALRALVVPPRSDRVAGEGRRRPAGHHRPDLLESGTRPGPGILERPTACPGAMRIYGV